jgi:hypothetical protein
LISKSIKYQKKIISQQMCFHNEVAYSQQRAKNPRKSISRSHVHQTHLTSGNGREHTTTAHHSQIPTEATALRKVLQADEERWALLERRSPGGI